MLSEYEQRLLADALDKAQLTNLPAKMDPENFIWIEGIGKIKLIDGSYGFGIVKRNPDLSYTVTYINGATSPILHVEEVYPYNKIDRANIKKFSDKEDRNGRINYLQSLHLPYEIDFENASVADLNREIVKAAVFQQLNAMEE